jgi:hypothetical protein
MDLDSIASGLEAELALRTGVRFVSKDRHPLHVVLARALDLAGDLHAFVQAFGVDVGTLRAPSGDSYLRDTATTIGLEAAIPSTWGARSRLLVAAHEAQHAVQFREGVDAGWWPSVTSHSVLYLAGVVAKTEAGSLYVGKVEGDAFGVTAAVRWWLTGDAGEKGFALRSLEAIYNVNALAIETARGVLDSHYATMAAGLCPPIRSAKIALDYFERVCPHLRGRVSM